MSLPIDTENLLDFSSTFGFRLTLLRMAAGYCTPAELSQAMAEDDPEDRTSQTLVRNWERGKNLLGGKKMRELAQALSRGGNPSPGRLPWKLWIIESLVDESSNNSTLWTALKSWVQSSDVQRTVQDKHIKIAYLSSMLKRLFGDCAEPLDTRLVGAIIANVLPDFYKELLIIGKIFDPTNMLEDVDEQQFAEPAWGLEIDKILEASVRANGVLDKAVELSPAFGNDTTRGA